MIGDKSIRYGTGRKAVRRTKNQSSHARAGLKRKGTNTYVDATGDPFHRIGKGSTSRFAPGAAGHSSGRPVARADFRTVKPAKPRSNLRVTEPRSSLLNVERELRESEKRAQKFSRQADLMRRRRRIKLSPGKGFSI